MLFVMSVMQWIVVVFDSFHRIGHYSLSAVYIYIYIYIYIYVWDLVCSYLHMIGSHLERHFY